MSGKRSMSDCAETVMAIFLVVRLVKFGEADGDCVIRASPPHPSSSLGMQQPSADTVLWIVMNDNEFFDPADEQDSF